MSFEAIWEGLVALMAEQAIVSVYQFGNNNPLSFNDPTGLQAKYDGEPERYMDRWGNIWHTPGVLHGISGLESVPYSYEDEFNIMTQRNSGGQNGGGWGGATVKAGYNNGQAGYWIGTSIPGEGAKGETLAEAKVLREFVAFDAQKEAALDWSGIGNATLGLLGGAGEWIVGRVGEWISGGTATPLTIPLFVVGGVRIGTNASRLLGYFTGHKHFANAMPTNIGAAVGKGIDMAEGKSFYEYGYGQAIGGGLNDVVSFMVTGGTGGALNDVLQNPSLFSSIMYINAYLGYADGLYEDFSPLEHQN